MAQTTTRKPLLPPAYFLLTIVLMAALHFVLPVAQLVEGPLRWVGGGLIAAGLGTIMWTERYFRKHDTTIKPFQESNALITEGPYRYSRNPLYACLLVALVGIWLLMGSLTPVFVVPAFAWLLTSRFITVEEAMLLERFGDEYRGYQRRVRRWV